MKKVLIIGSGGREHALAYKFSLSSQVTSVLVVPGNAGMLNTPKVFISDREDFVQAALEYMPDLVFIGPEKYLVSGLADRLRKKGISVIGPSSLASRLEGSKIFMKSFLKRHNIPTAKSYEAHSFEQSKNILSKFSDNEKIVIKTDSLASGKGVFICENNEDAHKRLEDIYFNDQFPVKSNSLVIEEFLNGYEISSFYYIDKDKVKYLGSACDHKRLFDGDKGPNTGGMGCYLPSDKQLTKNILEQINSIATTTANACMDEDMPYQGILFIGSMIHDEKVSVLEYNVRFGDPEAQTILPAIKNDLWNVFNLQNERVEIEHASVHVVACSENYSNLENKDLVLHKVIYYPSFYNDFNQKACLFFSGVSQVDGKLVNTGGRVLGITSFGDDHFECKTEVYDLLEQINFLGIHYRNDIGTNYV